MAGGPSLFGRYEFLVRRLHSLSGLVPVGAYMCVHLGVNASVLAGASTFQDNVDMIHSLGPALPLVEWGFIFLPLIFHAVVGVIIAVNCEPNTAAYPLRGNLRYSLQRGTAYVALVFILWHVFHLHGWVSSEGLKETLRESTWGAQFLPEFATSSLALALGSVFMKLVYAVGMLACVYHFANGLWTMGITWGLWVSPAAQRRADYVCGALGLVLAAIGLGAIWGVGRTDVAEARAIEQVRVERHETDAARVRELVDRNTASEPGTDSTEPPASNTPAADPAATVPAATGSTGSSDPGKSSEE